MMLLVLRLSLLIASGRWGTGGGWKRKPGHISYLNGKRIKYKDHCHKNMVNRHSFSVVP